MLGDKMSEVGGGEESSQQTPILAGLCWIMHVRANSRIDAKAQPEHPRYFPRYISHLSRGKHLGISWKVAKGMKRPHTPSSLSTYEYMLTESLYSQGQQIQVCCFFASTFPYFGKYLLTDVSHVFSQ